jgi:hypothetical protein
MHLNFENKPNFWLGGGVSVCLMTFSWGSYFETPNYEMRVYLVMTVTLRPNHFL